MQHPSALRRPRRPRPAPDPYAAAGAEPVLFAWSDAPAADLALPSGEITETAQARDALGFAKENAGDPFEPLFTGEAPVAFSVADASSRSQGLSCGDVSGQGAEEYAATLLDADVASGDVTVTFKITGMTGIVPGSYIRIDAEVLRVTAVNEAVLSVSRAQDNTIAAAHPEGTTIWVSTSPAIQRFL